MRISSGKLRGQRFASPGGNKTHPMGERIKTALFNILGDLKDADLLDAYAGSGALSFEAVSRGAAKSHAIEIDKSAFKILSDNIRKLGLNDAIKATRANCASWSRNNEDKKFDLILLDPPYEELNLSTINQLVKHLKPKGLMVLSHSGREATPTVNGVVVVDNRNYGDAALSIYRLDGQA